MSCRPTSGLATVAPAGLLAAALLLPAATALGAGTTLERAQAQFNEGDVAGAAATLERAIADAGANASARRAEMHELLAACRLYQSDVGAADEQLAAALYLDPDTKLSRELFPPERIAAFAALRKMLRARLPNLARAQHYFNDGAFAEAVLVLRLFVSLRPQPSTTERIAARTMLAASLLYLERGAEAEAEMRRLARLDPSVTLDPAVFTPEAVKRFARIRAEERGR